MNSPTTSPSRFSQWLGRQVIRFRWLVTVTTLILVLLAAYGIQFLELRNDARMWFGPDNPQLQALEELENTYTKINNVLFVITPKQGDIFTRQTLAAIEALTEQAWQIPLSNRVDSITNFQHSWAEEDDLIVEKLVDNAAALTTDQLTRIRSIALAEPTLVNRLLSPDGKVTGINVNISQQQESPEEVYEVTEFSQQLAEDIRSRFPDIELLVTGGVPYDYAFSEATEDDLRNLFPLMWLVLAVTAWLLLRSLSATIATVLVISFSTISAMGIAGWVGLNLNPASGIAPTIILTLAVADSIHVLVSILHAMRQGNSKHEAIVHSLHINLQPVFITSITTAIGFLSMNFSDAPPFHDLGNIVGIGVIIAWLLSIIFLPAVIAILPIYKTGQSTHNTLMIDHLANFVVKRHRMIFPVILVIIIVCLAGIRHIDLNDNFVEYLDEEYPVRKAADYTQENLTGLDAIEYSLGAASPGGIHEPEYLQALERFAQWYRKQAGVVHVYSLADTIKRLNQNMHADDMTYYRIPENREMAAQYLLLYEMSLPYGLDLNDRINIDKSASRLTVTLSNTTSKQLRQLDENAREWLKINAPGYMYAYGSGLSVMFAHVSDRNINTMLAGSILALVLISGILLFALRSVRIGALSLVPNLTPTFMAFGIWGYAVGQVGLASAVLIALTLGIVVDDTVHFLSKYLRARRESLLPAEEAIRYAFHTVGTALWVTTAILVAGFSTLGLSGYRVNADMGILTTLTILLALALDFLFLPVLLLLLDRKGTVTSKG